jgi:protein gp37
MLPDDWYDNPMKWCHVWLGVTAENQEEYDRRVPFLLSVPAAAHFVSVEPMLGPLDMRLNGHPVSSDEGLRQLERAAVASGSHVADVIALSRARRKRGVEDIPGVPGIHTGVAAAQVDWVICGGESGSQGRRMEASWARSLRDQCVEAGIAFFFKQWGQYTEAGERVGRKGDAGSLLDGRAWEEIPEASGLGRPAVIGSDDQQGASS